MIDYDYYIKKLGTNNMDSLYIKKLEDENKALVAKLETVRELESKIFDFENKCRQYRQEIEGLKMQNLSQAKMIGHLDRQLGGTVYNPLDSLTNYKTKIMEEFLDNTRCESVYLPFLREDELKTLKNNKV